MFKRLRICFIYLLVGRHLQLYFHIAMCLPVLRDQWRACFTSRLFHPPAVTRHCKRGALVRAKLYCVLVMVQTSLLSDVYLYLLILWYHYSLLTINNGLVRRALLRTSCLGLVFREWRRKRHALPQEIYTSIIRQTLYNVSSFELVAITFGPLGGNV